MKISDFIFKFKSFRMREEGLCRVRFFVNTQKTNLDFYIKVRLLRIGGAKGVRTPDLLNAIQTRYQLRYSPINMKLSASPPQEKRLFVLSKKLAAPGAKNCAFISGARKRFKSPGKQDLSQQPRRKPPKIFSA